MKTLLINAHPEPHNSYSSVAKMAERVMQHLPSDQLEVLNLYDMDIPELNANMLALFRKQANNETLSFNEQKLSEKMTALLNQFMTAERVIIAMPLYNFNIPARLKSYLDNVMVARKTFKYTENGAVGLMNGGRKVWLLQSSGSVDNDDDILLNISQQYLNGIFTQMMGFDEFILTRLEGTAVAGVDNQQALAKVLSEIDTKAKGIFEKCIE